MQTKQLYHQLYCGPKLLWTDFVWAEKVMGRFCHGPILLWDELSSDLGEDSQKQKIYRNFQRGLTLLIFGGLYAEIFKGP